MNEPFVTCVSCKSVYRRKKGEPAEQMSTGISEADTSRYVIFCCGNKPEQKYHRDSCRKHMKCKGEPSLTTNTVTLSEWRERRRVAQLHMSMQEVGVNMVEKW